MPSYYEALPIFRAAMTSAVSIDEAVQRFPKGHKYSLGNRLREAAADVIVLIARANRRAEREQQLGLSQLACSTGHPVAVALEEPEVCGQVKRRRLAYLFEPLDSKESSS